MEDALGSIVGNKLLNSFQFKLVYVANILQQIISLPQYIFFFPSQFKTLGLLEP